MLLQDYHATNIKSIADDLHLDTPDIERLRSEVSAKQKFWNLGHGKLIEME